MDLISKQMAIDAIEALDWYHQNINKDMVSGANSAEHQAWYKADDVYKTIEELPSADAVEIVRCKDCKHRYHSVECPCQNYDQFYSWMPADDWFCKKGERREE